MAIYYLDTEFNGFGGELISLALVRDDNYALYITYNLPSKIEPWVEQNVIPILRQIPELDYHEIYYDVDPVQAAYRICKFLQEDPHRYPTIIADWPDDISYLCRALIVGAGQMVPLQNLVFDLVRVDAYPTVLKGAVQHNALWDALALKKRIMPNSLP